MKRSMINLVLTVFFTFFIISFVSAEGQRDNGVNQRGSGMMGNSNDDCDFGGSDMMGGLGNFNSGTYPPSGERLTMEEAEESVLNYLKERRMISLELQELMEFQDNYYAQINESDTGINAFELLINPYSGYISPEPGPNMMWNSKYGHMGELDSMEMSISESDAVLKAKEYLDSNSSGLSVDEHADEFYGYYTIHTLKDGKIKGMLSINGYSGAVWYHSWHGMFIQMGETADNHS